jgi:hypothetical protein
MRNRTSIILALAILMVAGAALPQAKKGGDTAAGAPAAVAVHMVATVEPLKDDETTVASLTREDIKVKQGKNSLPVTGWVPSRGEQSGLQLFLLVDDTCDTSLGSYLDELRGFVEGQPASTVIGIGYMRNTTVNIVQNFTADHTKAAKALRLPMGSLGASDSPYLSLIGILKGWPQNKMRREVLMVSDGIDRLRGAMAPGSPMNGRSFAVPMPYISSDVDSASREAQKAGVIVHSIYARGVGHTGRNYWEINNGQNGLSKLSDETGGEAFYLGTQNAVSFKPYLDRLQTILNNQYFLVFEARPGKKADLQRIRTSTEAPKVEIVTADNVWVPTARSTSAEN